jgi:ribulose-bisphosphate carboxylase large chain
VIEDVQLDLSGERFVVCYHVSGDAGEAERRAEHICIEQTIEFPAELIGDDDIRRHIMGQVLGITQVGDDLWEVSISYACEITGYSLNQTLNVIFGNISLQPGVLVHSLLLPDSFTAHFRGPRFGQAGLRALCGEARDPLFCSALKPMGLSSRQLAQQAYEFALGGFHLIKDDHGISDQQFSRFRERVPLCVEAVERANRETGGNCKYLPTINSAANELVEDARWAKQQGAGGLLLLPGISGFDAMRCLADDDRIALPILAHPAWLGSFTASPSSGLSHFVLFGQLMRLAGADVSIHVNFGGRFAFNREACLSIVAGTACAMGKIKKSFPCPGGGMNVNNIPQMVSTYAADVVYLIGGAMHREGASISENCRNFRRLVQEERLHE